MSALAMEPTQERGDGAHILVVDDDQRIRSLLVRFLRSEGYRVSSAASAGEAMDRLQDMIFDLIVLDVMMPGESGKEIAARLRREGEPLRSVPILMLTALSEARDRVEGFEAGVDDFLAKPFEPRELGLRIASILRRARQAAGRAVKTLRFGDFLFDVERGELRGERGLVHLTTREREIMQALARSGGGTVSRRTLAQRGPGARRGAAERSVDVEIARLRHKLEKAIGESGRLQTVRGLGYRLLADDISEENGSTR